MATRHTVPITFLELSSTPSNPPSGYKKLFPKNDGFYIRTAGGLEYQIFDTLNAAGSNGISLSGTSIELGGTLVQDTTLTMAGYDLSIVGNIDLGGVFSIDYENAGQKYYTAVDSSSGIVLETRSLTLGKVASITLSGIDMSLFFDDGVDVKQLDIGSSGLVITDTIDGVGLTYAADYSGTFTIRSLVDKGYVDTVVAGVTLSDVLSVNNTTGANDIVLAGGQSIKTDVTGGTILSFDTGSSFDVSTDNQTYATPYIYLDNVTGEWDIGFPSALLSNSGTTTSLFTSNTLILQGADVAINGTIINNVYFDNSRGIDTASASDTLLIGLVNAGTINVGNNTSTFQVNSSTIKLASLTASTVPYIDSSTNLVSSTVSNTELGYLSGVTSSIQTQINNVAVQTIIIEVPDGGLGYSPTSAAYTFRMPYAFTLSEVRASLTAAQPSGSIFTVDVNESGVSILSTTLTIDNTEKTSVSAATPAVISDTALADNAEITIDIDQVGDPGATELKIYLIGKRS